MSVSRRSALFLLPAGLMAAWSRPLLAAPVLQSAFFAIEARTGGRLGVAALDAEGQTLAAWRAEERFALCSTFKLLWRRRCWRAWLRGANCSPDV